MTHNQSLRIGPQKSLCSGQDGRFALVLSNGVCKSVQQDPAGVVDDSWDLDGVADI